MAAKIGGKEERRKGRMEEWKNGGGVIMFS
jgi:hypothetical protein